VTLTDALASIEQVVDRDGLSGRLIRGSPVRPSEWVETGAGRAALRLTNGTSMRLDSGARVRLLSPSIIELSRGAIYLDTGPNATGLEVRTPFGVAHDIGTQFEVRVADNALRVRVRTGLVELRSGSIALPARPGTELTLASGNVVTRPFAAFGPEWDWAARLAPVFETEGRPLSVFLEHVCREQGWTLRYADAQLAREASGIILHGSLHGLDAADAVAAALRTSGLTSSLERGELLVMRPANRE
jgi:ferric-dicitrate binding protein FerR (iron transport regulator)